MDWETQFNRCAATHEGLVAKFLLTELGCDSRHWWKAARTNRWDLVSRRVLRAEASPQTEAQYVLAAVLDASPGAVLHGPSTLGWCGLGTYDLRDLQVGRVRGLTGANPTLAHVHRLRSLRAHDVTVIRGIATETVLRAIWTEAARYASANRVE